MLEWIDFYDDATKVTVNFSSTEHWVQIQQQVSPKMLLIIKLTNIYLTMKVSITYGKFAYFYTVVRISN